MPTRWAVSTLPSHKGTSSSNQKQAPRRKKGNQVTLLQEDRNHHRRSEVRRRSRAGCRHPCHWRVDCGGEKLREDPLYRPQHLCMRSWHSRRHPVRQPLHVLQSRTATSQFRQANQSQLIHHLHLQSPLQVPGSSRRLPHRGRLRRDGRSFSDAQR